MEPKNQKTKKSRAPKKEQPEAENQVNESAVEYTSKIRAIGNSKGVILNNQVLEIAGLKADMDILVQALNGLITIKQAVKPTVNTDLSTWENQLNAAIKAGDIPVGDLFEGMENEFDKTEW